MQNWLQVNYPRFIKTLRLEPTGLAHLGYHVMLEKHHKIHCVPKKSDAKIQITITMAYLIRIKYPLSRFNYHFSDVNVANFNKIHRTVSEQQLF